MAPGQASSSTPPTPSSQIEIPLGIWEELPRPFSVLAPMEEVTDTVFRRVVAAVGAPDLFFTEFTSTDGLCSDGRPRVIGRFRYTLSERPLIAQIWGNNPDFYRRVAAEVREMGFDGLDINMGCPVRKVVNRGSCGALIERPERAAALIAAAKDGAGPMPVSVKTRIGISTSRAEEWLGFLLSQRIAALTVHGRTVSQQSEGRADWSAVACAVRMRDAAGLPTRIIGNGDVRSAADFASRVRETGADGIMIGRGIFENLFLFGAIREARSNPDAAELEFCQLATFQKIDFFRAHLTLHRDTWGQGKGFDVLKKFAKTYLRSFEGAARLVDAVMRTHSHEEALAALDSWEAGRSGEMVG
jgi:tRNA-dihydrouridine synthase